MFSPFLSGFPLGSLLLSVGTRMLFGALIGLAFTFSKKRMRNRLWRILISAIAPKLHTLLVYSAMGLLFPELGYNYTTALHLKWRDAVFALICVIVVELLWMLYQSHAMQKVRFCIDQSIHNPFSIYKYMAYREYKGEMDELTGIMGRRMFMHYCNKAQDAGCEEAERYEAKENGRAGYVIKAYAPDNPEAGYS